MTKNHYILIYFGWIPPNDTFFGKDWSIIKKNDIFKLIKGEVTKEITEKDIINAICWKDENGKCVDKKDLPNFATREGFGWLVRNCFRYNISTKTNNTVPVFTTAYFIRFRDMVYDSLKERENIK